MVNQETVFITGGAGLLGSHIASKLVAKGYKVVVYDAFIRYSNPFFDSNNLEKQLQSRFQGVKDKVVFIRGDTSHKSFLQKSILEHKPSVIIHLAALPIADIGDKNPDEATSSIIDGTINILNIIKDVSFVRRFVYTSSSMVYGDFEHSPADEEHPKKPKSIYGGTKLAGEILTEAYARRYKIPYTIIRPSAIYGPGDVNRRVVQIFLEDAFEDRPIKLHNGGTSKLDFSFVEDVADGFILASFHPNAENQIFNITRGEGRQVKELVDIIQNLIGHQLKVEIIQPDFHRPERGALSIEKAKKLIGYNPKYSLEQGVEKYYKFFKQFYTDNAKR